METQPIKRSDYLSGKCTHREYYAQFVSSDTLAKVKRRFGIDKLVEAYGKDASFNTIPLSTWDILSYKPLLKIPMKLCDDYLTVSGGVCIFKEAAKQLVEKHLEKINEGVTK
jgi:hypothetical protein